MLGRMRVMGASVLCMLLTMQLACSDDMPTGTPERFPENRTFALADESKWLMMPPPEAEPSAPVQEALPYQELFQVAAARYGLDPAFLRAVAQVESRMDPNAVSRAGALGLMQLMPSTANELGVKNPLDPEESVDAGARLLRRLLDRFRDDVRLALAAYNAGPDAVERHGGVPPYSETLGYVDKVLDVWATMESGSTDGVAGW